MPTVWTAYFAAGGALVGIDHLPRTGVNDTVDLRHPGFARGNGFQKTVAVNAHGNNPAILELPAAR